MSNPDRTTEASPDPAGQTPVDHRRRRVFLLRICGYNYQQIAERIPGATERQVRHDMHFIAHQMLPGLGNPDGNSRGFRAAYVLGMAHAGASPGEIERQLSRLEQVACTEALPKTPSEPLHPVRPDA